MKSMFLVHRGEGFESQGSGRFAKDVFGIGRWVHPATGKDVVFDAARIRKHVANATRWIENGMSIPFPDGHKFDAMSTLGTWPGPFIEHRGKLVGVCEPRGAEVVQRVKDGRINAVSAFIEFSTPEHPVRDSKGNVYDEVVTHICATPYPVITGQGGFVKLSRDGGDQDVELWMPGEIGVTEFARPPADGESGDQAIQAAIDRLALAFDSPPTLAPGVTLGIHSLKLLTDSSWSVISAATDHLNAKGIPASIRSVYQKPDAAPSTPSVHHLMVHPKNQTLAEAALKAFIPQLRNDAKRAGALAAASAFVEMACAAGSAGMPGGSFDACVALMKRQGRDDASARRICGALKAKSGEK